MQLFIVVFNALMMTGSQERRAMLHQWTLWIFAAHPRADQLGWETVGWDSEDVPVIDLTDEAYVDDLLSLLAVPDLECICLVARLWEHIVSFGDSTLSTFETTHCPVWKRHTSVVGKTGCPVWK